MRYISLILIIALISLIVSGCNINDTGISIKKDINYNDENYNGDNINTVHKQTISEYFNNQKIYAYRKIFNTKIKCYSDYCPDSEEPMEYFIDEKCYFCNSSSEVYDDDIIAHVSAMNWADFTTTCSEDHKFRHPEKYKIIKKTDNEIIANGIGHGLVTKKGKGCDKTYNYTFETNETWIFTTVEPKGDISIKTESDEIISNGIKTKPKYKEEFSNKGITVECKSDRFRVRPWIKLIQYNQYNATKNQNLLKIKKDSKEYYKNPERFTFTSMSNGMFIVKPICQIYGKGSSIINVIESNETYKIIVKGAEKELDDKWARENMGLINK